MDYCLLQLAPDDPEQAVWLKGSTGQAGGRVSQGPLREAAADCAGRHCVLLVPTEQVLLTEVEVQARQAAKLRKAVPYALEERLAEDVDLLHFALGKTQNGRTEVAVVRRTLIEQLLAALEPYGIRPHACLPDVLALPRAEDGWSALIVGERCLLRTAESRGIACEAGDMGIYLQALLASGPAPAAIQIWHPADAPPPVVGLPPEAPPARITALHEHPLRLLAQSWQPRRGINLLQGSFATQTDWAKRLQPWRWAAVLAGLWVGLLYMQQLLERQQLRREIAELGKASEQLLRQTFPDVQRVVNPRAQMEQRLKALRAGGEQDGPDFLELLAQSGPLLKQEPQLNLDGLSFRKGQLDLKLTAQSLTQLDALKEKLERQPGISAELRGADSGKVRASAQIRISKK